jgi:hypothetical protein
MPSLRTRQSQSIERSLCHGVPGLLHAPCDERVPAAPGRGRHAGGGAAPSRQGWPGAGVGVRAPDARETPLSQAEVRHGARLGLWPGVEVCDLPVVQRWLPAGSWEAKQAGAAATVWGGLG